MMTLRPFSPRFEPVRGEQLRDLLRLFQRAYERHHDLHVRESHFLAHALECAAFELEARTEGFIDVARGAAKPEHRIFLVRFVLPTADEIRVLVRLEIRQAHDHGFGRERGGNRARCLRTVCRCRTRPGPHNLPSGDGSSAADSGRQLIEFEQRARVHADHAIDDELEPGETDASCGMPAKSNARSGLPTFIMIFVGIGGQRVELDVLLLERQRAFVHEAGVAFGA